LGFLGLDSAGRTWAWAPTLLYTTIAVLDNFDGRLARRSGMATPMGARLDMEYDALGNLAGYAVAVRFGQLPPAFLTLGFLRYVFVVSHWVLEKRGRRSLALPESRARRIVASLQSGFLVGVLWPTVRPPVTTVAAALMGGALLASFGRDWLVSAGWVDAGDQAYRRAGKWVSEALFVFLPIPIRVAAAALMASSAVQPALSAPLGTAWARLGMVVAAGMLVLGAAARAAALAFLAAIALWAGDTAAPAGLGIVAGCGLVILLGSGASSLWEPEKRLFPE
jgi:phosphatidylglycerophosphate synthase